MKRPSRLRDPVTGALIDMETGERFLLEAVYRIGKDGEIVCSDDTSLPVYNFWTSPLRSEGLRGDTNLLEDPGTLSMLAGGPVRCRRQNDA